MAQVLQLMLTINEHCTEMIIFSLELSLVQLSVLLPCFYGVHHSYNVWADPTEIAVSFDSCDRSGIVA
jgi:hypothetical protein